MSSRKPLSITLSPKAQQDFIDILRYTGETWGEAQLLTYRNKINEALQVIGANPQRGRQRADLPSAYFSYTVGSHVIVYRLGVDDVAVVRILHQRMDLGRHL
jgi:toxin ParE1/3/4